VITVDANILLYAYNGDAPEHEAAERWLISAFSGDETLHLPWSSIHTFLRLSTNSRVFHPPYTTREAIAVVESWLNRPNVFLLEPGPQYWPRLRDVMMHAEVTRDLVMDAHLAALAIEHDATLYTADRDFRRFARLRVVNPLA
jgi:toxin-antitoxin system PIN domain toxin